MEELKDINLPCLVEDQIVFGARSPINIALIKYWGKIEEDLIIPYNSSISLTLNSTSSPLYTITTLRLSSKFQTNQLILNGKEEKADTPRLLRMIEKVTQNAKDGEFYSVQEKKVIILKREDLLNMKWKVNTWNTFPTASGLASSASGLSCLAFVLCKVYGVDESKMSGIARLGSGSACRSIYGGIVKWEKGYQIKSDLQNLKLIDQDSKAVPLFGKDHWSELRIKIIQLDAKPKKISSSEGMKLTTQTSELFHFRQEMIVEKRISEIQEAIKERNFQIFSDLIMKESNQLHALCLDTKPPLFYMNDDTKAIISQVQDINKEQGQNVIAYTVDAGSNIFLITLQKYEEKMSPFLKEHSYYECEVGEGTTELQINQLFEILKKK